MPTGKISLRALFVPQWEPNVECTVNNWTKIWTEQQCCLNMCHSGETLDRVSQNWHFVYQLLNDLNISEMIKHRFIRWEFTVKQRKFTYQHRSLTIFYTECEPKTFSISNLFVYYFCITLSRVNNNNKIVLQVKQFF